MKNYFSLLGTIASLVCYGTTASAAVIVPIGTLPPAPAYFYVTSAPGHKPVTAAFGATFSGPTSFDDIFEYTLPVHGTGSASVASNDPGLTITNVLVNGVSYSSAAAALGIHNFPVTGNLNTIEVIGQVDGAGNFSGGGTLSGTFGAVPEPASWAMMVIGMGIMGLALRRRRNASVTYA